MGVGNPRKFEWRVGRMGYVDGVDQRPPGKGIGYRRRAEHAAAVVEGPPRQLHRRIGTQSGLLQLRCNLTSSFVEFRHGVFSSQFPMDPMVTDRKSVV